MFTFRDALDDGGLISRRRPGYERRDEQLAMAAEVDAAIRRRGLLAVEAGTGVGKSFAYLIPAILWVVEKQARNYSLEEALGEEPSAPQEDAWEGNEPQEDVREEDEDDDDREEVGEDDRPRELRRVIVSTHTISLQEQLFQKDAPFINSILPFEFTVALAKGRSNYVCRRRFATAKKGASNGSLFDDSVQREFERLSKWLETTADGSKSDLDPAAPYDVWNEICCEQGNCLARKCRYYDNCFFQRARRRLENAGVVIVNHALLFSDLAVRGSGGSILPDYDVLIFDEAHTIEQVAAEHLGVEITEASVDYILSRIWNDRTNKGLVVEETSGGWSPDRELFVDVAKKVDECRFRSETHFANLREWLEERPGSNGRVFEKDIITSGLSEGLTQLKNSLRRAADSLEDQDRRVEYRSAANRIEALASAVSDWLGQRMEGMVYWLEASTQRQRPRIAMNAAPVDVAALLREKLFNVVPVVIAASATLTTGGGQKFARGRSARKAPPREKVVVDAIAASPQDESEETRRAFRFFRSRVGMTGASARTLGSPFDYRKQMTLVLTKGLELSDAAALGMSREERMAENERRLCAAIAGYVDETDGGAFALFTNSAQMKRITAMIAPYLSERNYPFFSQSDGMARQIMTERFRESGRGVLFGVDSFWQGVDVPGEALRNVIIVRLPFMAPEQPLVEARLEAIRDRGGNDFREYLLPSAILKFKQGVGRLIRTKSDTGQVVLLDERIHTKSYGRDFLASLPDCKLRVDVFDGQTPSGRAD